MCSHFLREHFSYLDIVPLPLKKLSVNETAGLSLVKLRTCLWIVDFPIIRSIFGPVDNPLEQRSAENHDCQQALNYLGKTIILTNTSSEKYES